MAEPRRHTREYAEQQRRIESLGGVVADLQELAEQSPDEIRGFFYSERFAPVVSKLLKPIIHLGQDSKGFQELVELVHPQGPEVLRTWVNRRYVGEVRRMPYSLHATSGDLTLMLPLKPPGNLLNEKIPDVVSLRGERSSIVEDPALAVGAMTEFTTRLRSAMGYEEVPATAEVAA